MNVTKGDLINSVKRVFPGMNNTTADTMFDEVDREIRSQVHLNSDYESINSIVNGTASYLLTNNVMGVYEARWQKSSTTNDFVALVETHRDTIAQNDREYLKRTAAVPSHYYIDGDSLALYPTPTINSVNSYPRVIARVDRGPIVNNATAIAGDVPSHDAWKYGVCAKYGTDIGDPRSQGFAVAFEKALNRLHKWHNAKNRFVGPTVKSNAFYANPQVR